MDLPDTTEQNLDYEPVLEIIKKDLTTAVVQTLCFKSAFSIGSFRLSHSTGPEDIEEMFHFLFLNKCRVKFLILKFL